jgi:hypothetical protein
LFQNWTVHGSFGSEIENLECMDAFIKEMLSSYEIYKIKNSPSNKGDSKSSSSHSSNYNNGDAKKFSFSNLKNDSISSTEEIKGSSNLMRLKSLINGELKMTNEKLQRFSSFMIPKESIEKQILQTAVDILSQSIIHHSDTSEDSEESP